MQKPNVSKSPKWLPVGLPVMLCLLLFASILTVTILSSNIIYPQLIFRTTSSTVGISQDPFGFPHSLQNQISGLQRQMGILLEQLHGASPESEALTKFSDQLLHIAIALDKFVEALSGFYGSSPTGELHNYTAPKPNRFIGKKNFLGVESINPSVGLPCASMASNVDRFMSYKVYRTCPDDWDVAQKLMISGCDPLPRRRCFSKTPPRYSKPLPTNSSLWSQPSDINILWSHYKCKYYSCLVSNKTIGKRGFFKCSNCFDLSKRGWEIQMNKSTSAEFTIDDVLRMKPGEIRIGLDFSSTTGTFAALMKERNVTIASATLNLGAPFNEVIALRGLLPLYLSIDSRLPFFDNTLDIIHSTLFLDGWIGIELLQFVLFDWDRVLRPNGLLWVDRFFCKRDDLKMYLDEFSRLDYRKLLWRVVPKTDKMEDECYFSAVLEKPLRS
ncbi:hypothetical protein DITRI_Ditri11bG0029000 [Diplodiscus trichospermus]